MKYTPIYSLTFHHFLGYVIMPFSQKLLPIGKIEGNRFSRASFVANSSQAKYFEIKRKRYGNELMGGS